MQGNEVVAAAMPGQTTGGLQADPLLRTSVVLTLGTLVLNDSSWLYDVMMSRRLVHQTDAALTAHIGLLLALTVSANTIHTGLYSLVARLSTAGDTHTIRGIVPIVLRYVTSVRKNQATASGGTLTPLVAHVNDGSG